ncbi:MAG: DnaJ domain-containing protein [Nitrospiraceae bacterium]|nr:DnaJ domain-containing protein [Nitrospiraceae bacterium]
MAQTLKYNLRNLSLQKILFKLNHERLTGTLAVTTPNFTKKVYLVKGDAIFAGSTYEDDRLGEMLLKAGKITVDQYEESVKILKQTKKRQGAILVELGYLTAKDLFWGVKYQVKEIIHSLFLLEEGECEFIEGEVPKDEVITLQMSMGKLIYEGVKRINNWGMLKAHMPDADSVLRLTKDPRNLFQDVDLSPDDKKMLPQVDGIKTIKELIDGSFMGSFEAMKTLYILWSLGILEKKETVQADVKDTGETISLDDILQPFAEEEDKFVKKVREIYPNLNRLGPDKLLEVNGKSDADTIKKNYYRLSREFHPDRCFYAHDTTLKDKLTAIFDALSNAYEELKDETKRKQYFDSHPAPLGTSDLEENSTGASDGEKKFMLGTEKLKEDDYETAVELFNEAVKMNPKVAQYWSYLSLALSKIPNRLKEAEDALLETIKLEPMIGEHYANLGLLYAKEGLNKRAITQFEKALKFEAGNVKALKWLKKIKGQ